MEGMFDIPMAIHTRDRNIQIACCLPFWTDNYMIVYSLSFVLNLSCYLNVSSFMVGGVWM